MAEISESSQENHILHYRNTKEHFSRQTSFKDNCSDCLKVRSILCMPSIRKYDRRPKAKQFSDLKEETEENKLIKSFFLSSCIEDVE